MKGLPNMGPLKNRGEGDIRVQSRGSIHGEHRSGKAFNPEADPTRQPLRNVRAKKTDNCWKDGEKVTNTKLESGTMVEV